MNRDKLEKVTHLEYVKKEKELLKDFGKVDGMCDGVDCSNCPISKENIGFSCEDISEEAVLKRLDVVMSYQKTDWSRIPKDTPIRVWDDGHEGEEFNMYFSHYDNGLFYAFDDGKTSLETDKYYPWDNAELVDIGE